MIGVRTHRSGRIEQGTHHPSCKKKRMGIHLSGTYHDGHLHFHTQVYHRQNRTLIVSIKTRHERRGTRVKIQGMNGKGREKKRQRDGRQQTRVKSKGTDGKERDKRDKGRKTRNELQEVGTKDEVERREKNKTTGLMY